MRTVMEAADFRADKKDLPPKKRVWGFRAPSRQRIRKSASQVAESCRENAPTPTTIVLGRWFYLTPDPIGIDQGKNHLYAYVSDNPVNYADPLGLEKKCVLASSNNVGATSTYGHNRWIGLHIPEANFLEFELPCPQQGCCKATSLEPRIKPTSMPILGSFSKRPTFLRKISEVTPCGRSGFARYEMESRAAVFGATAVSLVELCYDCVQCK